MKKLKLQFEEKKLKHNGNVRKELLKRMGFSSTPMNIGASSQRERGFTIIELVIVFSVSAIIFAVVLSGYIDFSSKSDLKNIAFNIALTIREAQVYGVSVKEVREGNLSKFDIPYGVYFDTTNSYSYILFADSNNNKKYDNSDKIINTFTMKSDFEIKQLCITGGAPPNCNINSLAIIFKRPDPDAIFDPSGISATIKIRSKKTNDTKTVNITNTGQVSVQ